MPTLHVRNVPYELYERLRLQAMEQGRSLSAEVVHILQKQPPHPIVGYICRWLIIDEMPILNVAVHPDWRRRGIGRALMEQVLAEGRNSGVRNIILEVRDGNANAVELYSSVGFRRSSVRRDYYGQGRDGIVMTLQLEREQT